MTLSFLRAKVVVGFGEILYTGTMRGGSKKQQVGNVRNRKK